MNFIDSFCHNIKKDDCPYSFNAPFNARYSDFYAYIIRLFSCAAALNTPDYLPFT